MKQLALVSALAMLGTTATLSFSAPGAGSSSVLPADLVPGAAPKPNSAVASVPPVHLVTSGLPSPAAGDSCNDKTLEGKWGFTLQGSVLGPIGGFGAGLVSLVSVIDSNGSGAFTATGKANVGGVTITNTVTGSYAVNSDCTGTATWHYPGGWTMDLFFVITGEGNDRQVWLVNSNQPAVLHGTARKV